jgi:nitrogen fixation/metabolism regulation signal transduction histidine kinase
MGVEPPTGLEPKRRARRHAMVFAALAAALAAFTGLQAHLRSYDFPNFVLHAVFNLNFVLLLVLLILLGRSLFKLNELRRQPKAPGALPVRLVLYTLALVLPITLLFFISLSETLIAVVEKWFEPPIDRMLDDALEASEASLQIACAAAPEKVPAQLEDLVGSVRQQVADYKEIKRLHVPVRKSYVMALGLLALAALFSATWAAFKVAGGISAPISRLAQEAQRLAEEAQALAEGRSGLEPRPPFVLGRSAPAEIHTLVRSFEHMRQTLQERTAELIQAQRLAAWREAARRVAHEIKNPLTPIQLSAQRLRRRAHELPEPLRGLVEECTETIVEEVETMRRLVSDFSQFARLPRPQPVPSDLNGLARAVAALFQESGVIRLELSPELPPLLLDPSLMRQVLVNLVKNGLEATGGRGPVCLSTAYQALLGTVRLTVSDAGPGIAPQMRDKLFLPDFSTKREGTGLGLSLVHQIVTDHAGHVRMRSAPGQGTAVVVELPVSP